ncbi:MAG: phosphotransferase family protein, partial [Gammaproteobacteria bacterium]|nr:phosphotransferase family protein [Gammaproteobacteria bacterium]
GLSFWSDDVTLEPLRGGLSNQSFVVTDNGRKYVARYGEDIPFHHVIRSRELQISRAAAALGLSPQVRFAADGVMIFDFIEGATYTPEDVPPNLPKVVELIKKCHAEMHNYVRGPASLFWVFHVLRDYAHTLREGNSRMCPQLPRLMAIAEELEAAAGEPTIAICHADLLAANFIDDWEYGGFGNIWFDLGNVCAMSNFSRATEAQLLSDYFGREPDEHDWRRLDAMCCAAHLRETMWAMVSEIHMVTDVDYEAYTAEQLTGFETAHARYRERYGLPAPA